MKTEITNILTSLCGMSLFWIPPWGWLKKAETWRITALPHVKYVLNLQSIVVIELPEDGILVPKQVQVGTEYEVCFIVI